MSSLQILDKLSSPLVAWSMLLTLAFLYFLRPRKAKVVDAPPMVLYSPVVRIPLIGQALEFALSPMNMVKRCYEQYGPVFTVPVGVFLGPRLFFIC